MAASAARRQGPDWSCLPADVLRSISRRASTWQLPGPCAIASLCRAWRSAAAGCSGIRLLYQPTGSYSRARSFATWLENNGHQLQSLTIITFKRGDALEVLGPLAEAALTAAEAGRPLPLHTLRVLGSDGPTQQMTGKLLARLPNLLTLDAAVCDVARPTAHTLEQLAPLEQATQLQQLHLAGLSCEPDCIEAVARLLPTSLCRLSWRTSYAYGGFPPDLSHLTHLSFLQLLGVTESSLASSRLPPGLQQLQLQLNTTEEVPAEAMEEQKGVLVGFENVRNPYDSALHIPDLPNLTTATVTAEVLQLSAVRDALTRLPGLCTLSVREDTLSYSPDDALNKVVSTAASLRNLRHLALDLCAMPPAAGLAALTGLTRLTVALGNASTFRKQQQCEWSEELGRMPALKWLSVPGQLLLVERPWLGGLQQLRVLVLNRLLHKTDKPTASILERIVQQLEGSSPLVLPPRLLLLGLTGIYMHHAGSHRLFHRMRCLLNSSGCDVVGGPDLDEVADPVKQLAGLPVELQRALLP